MKTSVLIIAHNEELHIKKCIESVLEQTEKPDEVVVIVHNSTDKTQDIASTYPVTVVAYTGPVGVTYARIEGLRHVTGDIVLCIDGDAYAAKNWCAIMKSTLQGNVLVGSWVKLKGGIVSWISNVFNYARCATKNERALRWVWGASMGFWQKDKEHIRNIFEQSLVLSKELALSRNPDDLWLAIFMYKQGAVAVTNNTVVTAHAKEKSICASVARNRENRQNGDRIEKYVKTNFYKN